MFLETMLEDSNVMSTCRDAVRKAKAQLNLKLTRDVKNDKKGFLRYGKNKQKQGKY